MEAQSPQQGPEESGAPRLLQAHDFTRFDKLMLAMSKWRDLDHEDALILGRSEVVDLVEGVKQLRGIF